MSDKRWYKLDNSAKIMPSMTNSLNTNVFRLSCTLKEDVNPDILKLAMMEACSEFPMFMCTMKSGLFWHYLETSHVMPVVLEEKSYPLSKIDNGLLFRLTYHKKRINLEVYHVLADGNGAMEFLKFIVASYLDKVHGMNYHVGLNKASEYEKASDDFSKFDKGSRRIKFSKNKIAYKFKFPRKEDTIPDIIEIHTSCTKVKECAHKYGTTVTIYLASILISSIIRCAKVKDLKKPIGITVPIDLRNVFPSQTTRNFFYAVGIQYEYRDTYQIQDIVDVLKAKFDKEFSKENLQELLDSYMILEKFLLIRIIPNVLKDFILGLITVRRDTETMALSNMGVINFPKEYEDYVESFSGMMSSTGLHLTAMSYKEKLVLSFTSHYLTNEIERSMVKLLKEDGIDDILIVSNKEEA